MDERPKQPQPESPQEQAGHHRLPAGETPGFFDKKRNVDLIFYALCAICAALVAVDLVHAYHKHAHFSFEEFPAFHAGFGFLAYVGLVVTATQLRRVLKRREDYYD